MRNEGKPGADRRASNPAQIFLALPLGTGMTGVITPECPRFRQRNRKIAGATSKAHIDAGG